MGFSCPGLGPAGQQAVQSIVLLWQWQRWDSKQKHVKPLGPRHETGITCVCCSLDKTSYMFELNVKGQEVYSRDDDVRAKWLMKEEWTLGPVMQLATHSKVQPPLLLHQFLIQGLGTFLGVTHPIPIENRSAQVCFFVVFVFCFSGIYLH